MKFLERQAYDCMAMHHYHSALYFGHHADPLFTLYFISKKYTESGAVSGEGSSSRKLCSAFSVLFSECFDF